MSPTSNSHGARVHWARLLLACHACVALQIPSVVEDGALPPWDNEDSFDDVGSELLGLARQPVVTSLCRKSELLREDYHLHAGAENASRGREAWQTLFKHWNGKRVLLAGDSMMDQVFQVIQCAAEHMGGKTKLFNVAKFMWGHSPEAQQEPGLRLESGTLAINTSDKPFGFVRGDSSLNWDTQGLIYRITVPVGVPVDNAAPVAAKTIDYYRYYSLTGSCRTCAPGCGVCSDGKALVSRIDTLVTVAKQYDHVVINFGHEMGDRLRSGEVRDKVELVASSLATEGIASRTTFMEHPAQHFPGSTSGDWMGSLSHKECQCVNPDIDNQSMAVNNDIMVQVAGKYGINVTRTWRKFARYGCSFHRGPDCTHYLLSPTFWSPVALEMAFST